MGLDFRPAAIYNGGIYMSFWNVLLVIIVILAILLVVLYILGSRMQKRQAEQQTMIDASKQTVSILAIDKKKLKIGDSGLPKMVIDQTPWYMKWAKLPIVKAKIGPKVVTMIADEKVFLQLPLRTEAKVVIISQRLRACAEASRRCRRRKNSLTVSRKIQKRQQRKNLPSPRKINNGS